MMTEQFGETTRRQIVVQSAAASDQQAGYETSSTNSVPLSAFYPRKRALRYMRARCKVAYVWNGWARMAARRFYSVRILSAAIASRNGCDEAQGALAGASRAELLNWVTKGVSGHDSTLRLAKTCYRASQLSQDMIRFL
jgi:hypothetical protein